MSEVATQEQAPVITMELARPQWALPAQSLLQLEEEFWALLDTEDLVPSDQRQKFAMELQSAFAKTVAKRDRTKAFIKHCRDRRDSIKKQREDLQRVSNAYQSAEDFVRQYIKFVIESLGRDEKGKYRKLKGDTSTFYLSDAESKLKILEPETIPAKYKLATITLPAAQWEELKRQHEHLDTVAQKVSLDIDEDRIKDDLEAGEEVPGADLEMNRTTLNVR